MSSSDFVVFLLELSTLLVCGLAGGYLMLRLGQPAVLGEMLGGIVLGPTVVGWLAPDAYAALFTSSPEATVMRDSLIKFGMLFFLFSVGLEIRLDQLTRFGTTAVAVGLLGTLVPLLSGAAAVYLIPQIWGPQADEHRLAFALFIGAAMANTANPLLARILLDLGLLKRDIGAMLMTATVVDDLVSWSFLLVVFDQFSGQGTTSPTTHVASLFGLLAFLGALLILGRYLLQPMLRWSVTGLQNSSLTLAMVSVCVLVSAALAEQLDLHAFLGPFVLGIALSYSQRELGPTYDAMNEFVLGFFVPIYFVSMGLTANFIRDFDVMLVAVVLVVACVSKIGGVFAAATAVGLDRRTALGVSFGMNARGAIGIILAALGRERGVINEPVYVALVLMAIVTSVMAAPVMKSLLTEVEPSQLVRD